jgi:hypothetical protein
MVTTTMRTVIKFFKKELNYDLKSHNSFPGFAREIESLIDLTPTKKIFNYFFWKKSEEGS